MSYTRLRVNRHGVVLCDYHLQRLGITPTRMQPFVEVANRSAPAAWSLWLEDSVLRWQASGASALHDGIATGYARSPVADRHGPQPKTPAPCPYDDVRIPGSATLLTSEDEREIYEAARAAVLGWNGSRVVCAPSDRPRVWSTAEAAIRAHLPVTEAPLLVQSTMPLLLVNAVKGPCRISAAARQPFPQAIEDRIKALFEQLTHFPR